MGIKYDSPGGIRDIKELYYWLKFCLNSNFAENRIMCPQIQYKTMIDWNFPCIILVIVFLNFVLLISNSWKRKWLFEFKFCRKRYYVPQDTL